MVRVRKLELKCGRGAADKACSNCQRILPTSDFGRQTVSSDGLKPHCKACEATRVGIWYLRNQQRQIAAAKNWAGNNPEMARRVAQQSQRNRRGRKLSAPGKFTRAQWEGLLDYFNSCCAYCLRHASDVGKMTADHMVPLSRGGSNWIENIAPACRWCNGSKSDRTVIEYAAWRCQAVSLGVA